MSEETDDWVYCRECGAKIRRAAEICPDCGIRQRPPPTSPAVESVLDGRNPLVAALLSALFPGLGHIYAREIETGLFFAVSFILAVLSLIVFIGIVLVPAIWLYALYDAAKSAQRRDDELTTAYVS
ncbi:zinc ribbon domain-containing protein [Halorientalis salina]|uniref:zinc ribbon domain-containing protein n=1 Tax=Halorientalis salina TaxID=2932266 RepID=UPI0010ACCADD|nr:zinc ribbon domain-containing protein [Halorientalis salina]